MKQLSIQVTNKQYYLLERIAKADDRRLNDLLYLIFSSGLGVYFCEKSIYISKNDDEFTEDEIKQKKINNKLIEIKYDKLDYWTMYVEGDLSLEELLKLLEINDIFENYNKIK